MIIVIFDEKEYLMVLTPECESFLYFEILSLKCEADFLNSAFYILLDHQMIKPYLGNWYA